MKNTNLKLSIITSEKDIKMKSPSENINIKALKIMKDSIIKFYDESNIYFTFFTEGHPQVLDEALVRHRPVIIFEEISHVLRDRKGIFISKEILIHLMRL